MLYQISTIFWTVILKNIRFQAGTNKLDLLDLIQNFAILIYTKLELNKLN